MLKSVASYLVPFLIFFSWSAAAQTEGRVEGVVLDALTLQSISGVRVSGEIPDFLVSWSSHAASSRRCGAHPVKFATLTSSDGHFDLALPLGSCGIDLELSGYRPYTALAPILLGETRFERTQLVTTDFQGSIVIDVHHDYQHEASRGATILSDQSDSIPYGRDARTFDQALTSIPGTIGEMPSLRIHGAGLTETAWSIEGMNVADPVYGGLATPLLQDFMDQVSVDTEGVGAAFDSQLGPRVSAMLKSGTNQFHGSVFAHLSPFEAQRAQLSSAGQSIATQISQAFNFDVGGTLGGPLIKDRLWVFAGFAPHVEKQTVARIIQAQSDSGDGHAELDSSGTPVTKEVARDSYGATQTTYEYVAKLDYALADSQTLTLAAFGNFGASSGVDTVNLVGNEGTFLRDRTGNANDFVLRYAGRFNDSRTLVDATAGFHSQCGSTGGGNASSNSYDDTPQILWNTSSANLRNPLFATGGGVPPAQTSAPVSSACAIDMTGFNPCPVSDYTSGGPGYSQTDRTWRLGGTLALTQLFELFGHHRFQVGGEVWRDALTRYQGYSGGQIFEGEFRGSQLAFYEGFGFGHADPAMPQLPAYDPNNPGHFAGETLAARVDSTMVAAFAEETWGFLEHVTVKAGLRVQSQTLNGSGPSATAVAGAPASSPGFSDVAWLPRIALRYDVDRQGGLQFNASYSRLSERIPLDIAASLLSASPYIEHAVTASGCTNPADPRTCPTFVGGAPGGRTYSFNPSPGVPVLNGTQAPGANEWQAGARWRIWRDLVASLNVVYDSFDHPIGYLDNPAGCCQLGNPGAANYPAIGAQGESLQHPVQRDYAGGTLALRTSLFEGWFVSAAYTLSRYEGNQDGMVQAVAGPLRTALIRSYDLTQIENPNQVGPLQPNSQSSFKLDGARRIELTSKSALNVGAALRVRQGNPTNYLGTNFFTGPGTLNILPAGSGAQTPWIWQLDLRVAYQQQLGNKQDDPHFFEVSLDVFNLTDNRGVLSTDQDYTFDRVQPIVNGTVASLPNLKNTSGAPVAQNPGFGQPTSYQLPLSLRLGAKLAF
jgi:hypothetical protein